MILLRLGLWVFVAFFFFGAAVVEFSLARHGSIWLQPGTIFVLAMSSIGGALLGALAESWTRVP